MDTQLIGRGGNDFTPVDVRIILRYALQSKANSMILIHNHPDGVNRFSEIDDDVEYHLFKLAFNRNVGANSHASLILLTEGNFVGRVWKHDLSTEPISMIRIIGDRIKLNYPNQTDEYESPEIFNRQQLAFGRSLIQDLSNLKISIIGAGATGSATALLLTRLGVGELCIIKNGSQIKNVLSN